MTFSSLLQASAARAARPLAVGLALLAAPAHAADDLWSVFETRCLVPYEHLALPDTRGPTRDGETWTGDGVLDVTITQSACAVTGGAVADLKPLLAERDEYVLTDGVWQSTTWREPKIEVEALADGYLVRETNLES
ncbi:MAG: hypothetical protein AAGE03_02620 [Pseudomonadota bacterium]